MDAWIDGSLCLNDDVLWIVLMFELNCLVCRVGVIPEA